MIIESSAIYVITISALLSLVELLQKFGAHSCKTLVKTIGFYAYIGINVVASVVALGLYDHLVPVDKNPMMAIPIMKVIICAAGAMTLARSSFFQTRDGTGKMLDIGIATILNGCMSLIDRAIDQTLVKDRWSAVTNAMDPLTANEALDRLPALCIGSLTQLSDNQKKELLDEIMAIKSSCPWEQDQKNLVGHCLLRTVGPAVMSESSKIVVAGRVKVAAEEAETDELEKKLLMQSQENQSIMTHD